MAVRGGAYSGSPDGFTLSGRSPASKARTSASRYLRCPPGVRTAPNKPFVRPAGDHLDSDAEHSRHFAWSQQPFYFRFRVDRHRHTVPGLELDEQPALRFTCTIMRCCAILTPARASRSSSSGDAAQPPGGPTRRCAEEGVDPARCPSVRGPSSTCFSVKAMAANVDKEVSAPGTVALSDRSSPTPEYFLSEVRPCPFRRVESGLRATRAPVGAANRLAAQDFAVRRPDNLLMQHRPSAGHRPSAAGSRRSTTGARSAQNAVRSPR